MKKFSYFQLDKIHKNKSEHQNTRQSAERLGAESLSSLEAKIAQGKQETKITLDQITIEQQQTSQRSEQAKALIQKCHDVMDIEYKDHYNINRSFQVMGLKTDKTGSRLSPQKIEWETIEIEKTAVLKTVKQNPYLPNCHNRSLLSFRSESGESQSLNQPSINVQKLNLLETWKLKDKNYRDGYEQKKKQKEKVEKQLRLIRLQYLFRKNIKIIIRRLKSMRVTYKDIIEYKILSKEPYRFGKQIFAAVKEGDDAKTFRIYMQNKFSIFGVDTSEKTLLMWACMRGHLKIMLFLLQNGVSTARRDISHQTALDYAIKYDNEQCVKHLMLYEQESLGLLEVKKRMQSGMSDKVRKIVQVVLYTVKYMKDFSFQKKLEYFAEQYKYYYPE